jgi:hypothetical protein
MYRLFFRPCDLGVTKKTEDAVFKVYLQHYEDNALVKHHISATTHLTSVLFITNFMTVLYQFYLLQ